MQLQQHMTVQPRPSAVNMMLPVPAFAAERRAAAPLLLSAVAVQLVRGTGARSCRSISPACRALSSKPAGHRPLLLSIDGTD